MARPPAQWSDNTRAVVSIVLFAHVFVVSVCLAANLAPSTLEQRLLQFFQPYAQLLNFDLDGTRYYLTHATVRDVDHRIEVLPAAATGDADDQWAWLARGRVAVSVTIVTSVSPMRWPSSKRTNPGPRCWPKG